MYSDVNVSKSELPDLLDIKSLMNYSNEGDASCTLKREIVTIFTRLQRIEEELAFLGSDMNNLCNSIIIVINHTLDQRHSITSNRYQYNSTISRYAKEESGMTRLQISAIYVKLEKLHKALHKELHRYFIMFKDYIDITPYQMRLPPQEVMLSDTELSNTELMESDHCSDESEPEAY